MKRLPNFKKTFGVSKFYTDPTKRFVFYYRRNWMDQFDVMVYDIAAGTNRWFMVTPSVFFTMLGIEQFGFIKTNKKNILDHPYTSLHKDMNTLKYTLISHNPGKFAGESVYAFISKYSVDEGLKSDVLLLKRVAFVASLGNTIIGMDTLELPLDGVKKLVKDIKKKYFKDVKIELEFDDEKEKK